MKASVFLTLKKTHIAVNVIQGLSAFIVNGKVWCVIYLIKCIISITKPVPVYLVNKPLKAAGMSADTLRGREIVRKMNIWPRIEALRAHAKFSVSEDNE